jgi:hypothetical protein
MLIAKISATMIGPVREQPREHGANLGTLPASHTGLINGTQKYWPYRKTNTIETLIPISKRSQKSIYTYATNRVSGGNPSGHAVSRMTDHITVKKSQKYPVRH